MDTTIARPHTATLTNNTSCTTTVKQGLPLGCPSVSLSLLFSDSDHLGGPHTSGFVKLTPVNAKQMSLHTQNCQL